MTQPGRSDFLADMVAERTARNPDFPGLVEAALDRRELMRALAAERRAIGLTQTEMAAVLGTSQSQVARLESGNADARLSTVARFAAALGKRIEFRLESATGRR
jgi:DNA-binding XRE family transcriptional regulator